MAGGSCVASPSLPFSPFSLQRGRGALEMNSFTRTCTNLGFVSARSIGAYAKAEIDCFRCLLRNSVSDPTHENARNCEIVSPLATCLRNPTGVHHEIP